MIATLVPNSDVEANLAIVEGEVNHWDNVDTDAEATYNGHQVADYARDLYGFSGKPTDIASVNSVALIAKITSWSTTPNQNSFKFAIRTDGVVTEEELAEFIDQDNGWITRTKQWATNPDTSSPFTASEVANLVAGFAARTAKGGATRRTICCYFYVEVDYEPAGWTGKISGVTDPAKVMGVAVANIAKVKGVS